MLKLYLKVKISSLKFVLENNELYQSKSVGYLLTERQLEIESVAEIQILFRDRYENDIDVSSITLEDLSIQGYETCSQTIVTFEFETDHFESPSLTAACSYKIIVTYQEKNIPCVNCQFIVTPGTIFLNFIK